MRQGSFQSTTLIAGVVLLLILFVSTSYFFQIPDLGEDVGTSSELAELRSNIERWQNERPTAFRYVVDRSCSCSSAFTAAYVANEIPGNRSATFNVVVESNSGTFLNEPPDPVWIEDIFKEIESALELHGTTIVDVSYDEHYGFPSQVDIHYPRPKTNMQYQVRDFEVLEYR